MFQLGRLTGFSHKHPGFTPGGGPAPGAHRYWRLANLVVPGGGYLEISELEFWEGATDVTTQGTPSSSSVPTGGVAALFDGNTGTRCYWTEQVACDPSFWIKLDFGAGNEKAIDGIKQAGYDTSNRYIQTFSLQYSDDNATWTTLGLKNGLTYPGNNTFSSLYSFGTPPTTNRSYFLFSITANNSDPNYVSFTGIELHTSISGADITAPDMTCTAISGSTPGGAIANTPGSAEWSSVSYTQPFYTWWAVNVNSGATPVTDADVVEYVMESQQTIAGGAATPTAWELLISDDGATYYPISQKSGISWSSPLQVQTFTL